MGNSLDCIDAGDNFLNRTSIAQALRSTIKWILAVKEISVNNQRAIYPFKKLAHILISYKQGRVLDIKPVHQQG